MSTDAAANLPISPGDVIADKYRVERVLGRGGMGVVVAAMHVHLDQRVALKFIVPGAVGDDSQAIERFMREARAAVRLKSEHVAKVLDVGKLPEGSPYIVMEFLEGRDLAAVVEADGPLDPERAADFVLQACEAIAEAHASGIVHRDLKPQNLFLTRGVGNVALVKVLDFGVSKVRDTSGVDSSLTRTSSVMGSPMYMAPEQMRSARAADARSDIWALGVVLYVLLTGRTPFEAETMTELALKVVQDPHTAISALRPEVPPGLIAVVDRCLAKDPSQRFQDVSDLALTLAEFAPPASRVVAEHTRAILRRSNNPPPARQTSSPGRVTMPSATLATAQTVSGDTFSRERRARSRALAVGAAAAVIAVAAGFMFLGRGKAPVSTDTPSAGLAHGATVVPASPSSPPTAAPAASASPTIVVVSPPPAAPAAPDSGSVPSPQGRAGAGGSRPGGGAKPPPRRPAPGASSSTHDDEIPALR